MSSEVLADRDNPNPDDGTPYEIDGFITKNGYNHMLNENFRILRDNLVQPKTGYVNVRIGPEHWAGVKQITPAEWCSIQANLPTSLPWDVLQKSADERTMIALDAKDTWMRRALAAEAKLKEIAIAAQEILR